MYIYLIKAGDFLSLTKQQLGLVIHTPPFFFFQDDKVSSNKELDFPH